MNFGRALIGVLFAAPLGWVAAALSLDLYGSVPHGDGPWDYVVVAGAGVRPGGVASETLAARTRGAVALWKDGVAPRVGFTGGVGDWPPAEAVVAAGLAEAAGVPRAVMVLEDASTSTEENAAELAARIGPDARVLVVTDRFHALRCGRVFGRHFEHVGTVGVVSPTRYRVTYSLREVAALGWYGVTGRL